VSSRFCLLVALKEHLPGRRLAINANANYFITSSTQTMARMETIVLLHCRGRKSGVYHLLPRAIRNKLLGVSVLITVCFKTPVHTVRHARNTPANALSLFGLSACGWMHTKNLPIRCGTRGTAPYWQAARCMETASVRAHFRYNFRSRAVFLEFI